LPAASTIAEGAGGTTIVAIVAGGLVSPTGRGGEGERAAGRPDPGPGQPGRLAARPVQRLASALEKRLELA
jgi:hypothetical protein